MVVENFTPGVMERLGLGYASLREQAPSIIMCSLSGYGQTGPHAHRPRLRDEHGAGLGYLDADRLPRHGADEDRADLDRPLRRLPGRGRRHRRADPPRPHRRGPARRGLDAGGGDPDAGRAHRRVPAARAASWAQRRAPRGHGARLLRVRGRGRLAGRSPSATRPSGAPAATRSATPSGSTIRASPRPETATSITTPSTRRSRSGPRGARSSRRHNCCRRRACPPRPCSPATRCSPTSSSRRASSSTRSRSSTSARSRSSATSVRASTAAACRRAVAGPSLASTPTRCCARCWGLSDEELDGLAERGVTSGEPEAMMSPAARKSASLPFDALLEQRSLLRIDEDFREAIDAQGRAPQGARRQALTAVAGSLTPSAGRGRAWR